MQTKTAENSDSTVLASGEPHPACKSALAWIAGHAADLPATLEALSSCAIENNRLAEICSGTLRRMLARQPVSDRYLLGLAWTLRDMEEAAAPDCQRRELSTILRDIVRDHEASMREVVETGNSEGTVLMPSLYTKAKAVLKKMETA